jgi:hypothetical protein
MRAARRAVVGLLAACALSGAAVAGDATPVAEIPATGLLAGITRVIPRGLEPPVLVLEDGQHWQPLETMVNVRFRAGDEILIRPGAPGSYFVSIPGRNGEWRVRRLR